MIRVISKMDLGFGEMGSIFCGKHPPLVTRTQVSDPGPMGPLVVVFLLWSNSLIFFFLQVTDRHLFFTTIWSAHSDIAITKEKLKNNAGHNRLGESSTFPKS